MTVFARGPGLLRLRYSHETYACNPIYQTRQLAAADGECNDGEDNDEDGNTDFPDDTNCRHMLDQSEGCNEFEDVDGDEWCDALDNCPDDFDPSQADQDEDGLGDVCDPFPNDPDNDLAQCSSDLGDCQIDVISCESDAAQCSTDLSQAEGSLITCNGDLSSCIGTATQLQTDLSQAQSDLSEAQTDITLLQADVTQLQSDLASTEADLTQTQADLELTEDSLAEAVADTDADGVRDTADTCPGTTADAEVDPVGCSQAQFCSEIDASTGQGTAICNTADWKSDEPLASSSGDCKATQGSCSALSP